MSQPRPAVSLRDQAPQESSAIEALRGLAALMVLLTHYVPLVRPEGAGLWGLASTGVDLFFVLSGFVFARNLAAPGFAVAPYLVRRFFRLYPLYAVALLVYALLQPTACRESWWLHLLMLHTTGSLELAAACNVAFWSLPPEVEFYLLLPLLAGGGAWLAQRGWPAFATLLGGALLIKLALVALASAEEPADGLRRVLTVHAPGLLVEFLLGSAAAIWGGHVRASTLASAWSAPVRRVVALSGGAALVALVGLYLQHVAPPGAAAMAPLWLQGTVGLWAAIGYAALLLLLPPAGVATDASAAARRIDWRRAALWAGRLSYGVYLFHNAAPIALQRAWPGLSGAGLAVVSVALTLSAAYALYRLVEAPCRAGGRRLAARL